MQVAVCEHKLTALLEASCQGRWDPTASLAAAMGTCGDAPPADALRPSLLALLQSEGRRLLHFFAWCRAPVPSDLPLHMIFASQPALSVQLQMACCIASQLHT